LKINIFLIFFALYNMSVRPLWKDFTYFSHQIDGINWMLDKEINGIQVPLTVRGGLQCDDMGLGKTIQIASVIINNYKPNTLIIAPLAMIETWSSLLQRAGCAVYEVSETWKLMNDPTKPVPRTKSRPTVYISNYEKLYCRPSLFLKSWDRVVLDEAHKIRNGDSEVARYARKLVSPIRWAVTGTPLVNSHKDIVSLLAFIGVPYSPLWRWEPRYDELLPRIIIHRSLDSLRKTIKNAPPLPEIHTMNLPFTTQEEEEFYFGVQGATESMVQKYSSELLSSAQSFKLLLRLRQISVHPQVYINSKRKEKGYTREDWKTPSTKLEAIKNIITSDTGIHKYIIFCQFYDEMTLIKEYLNPYVPNILQYSGSLTQQERTEILATSKESTEKTVLLIQLQAGGVGLNLQEYDRIIFVSPWWTSALMDQAIARAVRMGQTEVVKVYHLCLAAENSSAENSSTVNIDSLINSKAESKRIMLKDIFEKCEL